MEQCKSLVHSRHAKPQLVTKTEVDDDDDDKFYIREQYRRSCMAPSIVDTSGIDVHCYFTMTSVAST